MWFKVGGTSKLIQVGVKEKRSKARGEIWKKTVIQKERLLLRYTNKRKETTAKSQKSIKFGDIDPTLNNLNISIYITYHAFKSD